MDASVTPLPDQPGLSLVQTTDFFYPLVDDPYLQVNNLHPQVKGILFFRVDDPYLLYSRKILIVKDNDHYLQANTLIFR
jgi:hypothetical protein